MVMMKIYHHDQCQMISASGIEAIPMRPQSGL